MKGEKNKLITETFIGANDGNEYLGSLLSYMIRDIKYNVKENNRIIDGNIKVRLTVDTKKKDKGNELVKVKLIDNKGFYKYDEFKEKFIKPEIRTIEPFYDGDKKTGLKHHSFIYEKNIEENGETYLLYRER